MIQIGKKIENALFWFWKGNDITDEPAFDALKEGDIHTAWSIWDKLVSRTGENNEMFWNEVTAKNASAFHNRAILGLLNNKISSFTSAVMTNIKFIENDYFSEFAKSIVDVTCKVSKKDIELKFLEVIMNEISERKTKTSLSKLVKCLSNFDFVAKDDFLKSISQKLIANINVQAEIACKARTANRQNAAATGEILYKNTQNELVQLKEILGIQDLSYASTADKVANEILRCGIDYCDHYRDISTDPENLTMSVFKMAKAVAVGSSVKQCCDKNIEIIQEWIEKKEKDFLKRLMEAMDINRISIEVGVDGPIQKRMEEARSVHRDKFKFIRDEAESITDRIAEFNKNCC